MSWRSDATEFDRSQLASFLRAVVAQSLKGLARWAKKSPTVRFRAMKFGYIDKHDKVRNRLPTRTLGDLTREIEARRRRARTAP